MKIELKEIWKDIKGYEGLYQISNFGRIKKVPTNKILSIWINDKGYKSISLWKNKKHNSFQIHRLLALHFIPIPDQLKNIDLHKLSINHKDENKLNNDLDNLEWCTQEYNLSYGTARQRMINNRSIKISQFDLDGNFIKVWNNLTQLKRELNYNPGGIIGCCTGRNNRTAYGYIWRYWSNEHKIGYKLDFSKEMLSKKHVKIARCDKDTLQILETFNMAAEAAYKYNIKRTTLCEACNHNRVVAGYRWKRIKKEKEVFELNKKLDLSNLDNDLYHREVIKMSLYKNKIIKHYKNLMQAYENSGFVNLNNRWQDILACCQGLRPFALSMRYEFADNPIWSEGKYVK